MGFFSGKSEKKNGADKVFRKGASAAKRSTRTERMEKKYPEAKPPYAGIIFLWVLLGGTLIYILLFSPLLMFLSPSVRGGEAVPEIPLQAFVAEHLSGKHFGLFPKNNFLLFRPDRLERALLSEFPLFRRATVTRIFPDRLSVEVELRETLILFCSSGPCYLLSETGEALEATRALSQENQERSFFVNDLSGRPVTLGETIFDPAFPAFALEVRARFEERLGLGIQSQATVVSRFANDLRVRTTEGFEVYFSTEIPLDTSLNTLALLFEQELPAEKRAGLRYIDLRTDNRVYYAREGGDETEADTKPPEEPQSDTAKKETKKKKKD